MKATDTHTRNGVMRAAEFERVLRPKKMYRPVKVMTEKQYLAAKRSEQKTRTGHSVADPQSHHSLSGDGPFSDQLQAQPI